MGSSTTGSSTASSTSTYLYTLCHNFLIIHPKDLGLFYFEEQILSYKLIPKSMHQAQQKYLKNVKHMTKK